MRLCVGAALLASALMASGVAVAASCRGYPESVRLLVKGRVEAVRSLEREAADRLVGRDTRTFPYLAAEARKAADVIASPADLAEEEGLQRCRNLVYPVRGICRGAALALATVLDEHEAGATGTEAGRTYAEAMPRCESFMKLAPLSTAIRVIN